MRDKRDTPLRKWKYF